MSSAPLSTTITLTDPTLDEFNDALSHKNLKEVIIRGNITDNGKAIKLLRCSHYGLEKFQINDNQTLETIDIIAPELQSFDVSRCSMLNKLSDIRTSCKKLTYVNLSYCTNINTWDINNIVMHKDATMPALSELWLVGVFNLFLTVGVKNVSLLTFFTNGDFVQKLYLDEKHVNCPYAQNLEEFTNPNFFSRQAIYLYLSQHGNQTDKEIQNRIPMICNNCKVLFNHQR